MSKCIKKDKEFTFKSTISVINGSEKRLFRSFSLKNYSFTDLLTSAFCNFRDVPVNYTRNNLTREGFIK